MLGPAVHRGKDATHKTFETTCNARAWPHQYWKSCANGSNVVALRFGDHGTKEMLGVVGSFKLCATTCNKVCKRTQHVTSNNLASLARSLTLHKRRYPIYHDLFLVVCGVYNSHRACTHEDRSVKCAGEFFDERSGNIRKELQITWKWK